MSENQSGSAEPVLESGMGGADTGASPAGFREAAPLEEAEAREALEAIRSDAATPQQGAGQS